MTYMQNYNPPQRGNYGQYSNRQNFNNANTSGYSNRQAGLWGSTTLPKISPVALGSFTKHDAQILATTCAFLVWNDSRVMGIFDGLILYIGKTAINILEQQAKYKMPNLMYEDAFELSSQHYSCGSVPHINDPNACIVLGTEKCAMVIFTFIVDNIYTFTMCDPAAVQTTTQNPNVLPWAAQQLSFFNNQADMDYFRNLIGYTLSYIYADPFNKNNINYVIACLEKLRTEGFISTTAWNPRYRIEYLGWSHAPQYDRSQFTPDSDSLNVINHNYEPFDLLAEINREEQIEEALPEFDVNTMFGPLHEGYDQRVPKFNYGNYGMMRNHRFFMTQQQQARYAMQQQAPGQRNVESPFTEEQPNMRFIDPSDVPIHNTRED